MGSPVTERVRRHRTQMRAAGMRLLQLWVPDTRSAGFARACRRQAALVARADAADPDMQRFLDAALDDLGGWNA